MVEVKKVRVAVREEAAMAVETAAAQESAVDETPVEGREQMPIELLLLGCWCLCNCWGVTLHIAPHSFLPQCNRATLWRVHATAACQGDEEVSCCHYVRLVPDY
jgi:hypothetical protein